MPEQAMLIAKVVVDPSGRVKVTRGFPLTFESVDKRPNVLTILLEISAVKPDRIEPRPYKISGSGGIRKKRKAKEKAR